MNFSRRRLGKPQKAVIFWSDSDEAPEPDENQADAHSAASPVKIATPSIRKKEERSAVSSSSRQISTKKKEDPPKKKEDAPKLVKLVKKREVKETAPVTTKETAPKRRDAAAPSSAAVARRKAPVKQKVAPKSNSDDGELNARLAAIQIDAAAADVRPKRVTRSARK